MTYSKCKYLLLLLLFIPVIITITIIYDKDNNMFYLPTSLSMIAFIIFSVFPNIVLGLHARPIYYDDLIIKDYNEDDSKELYDDKFRKKYQYIFRCIITVTSTIVFFVASEVWYLKSDLVSGSDSSDAIIRADWAFAFGIIGGIMKLYYSASCLIGKMLLFILKTLKKRTIKKSRARMSEIAHAELGNAGIRIGDNISERRSRSYNDLTIIGVAPDVDMHDIMSHISTNQIN
jgi:hypothetical protein